MTIFVIVAIFIVFDVVTGLITAFYQKSVNSTKLRAGLMHKIGEILAITFTYFLNYAMNYIDLGITIPMCEIVCGYIAIMETISIIENISVLSPKMQNVFSKFFEKIHKEE